MYTTIVLLILQADNSAIDPAQLGGGSGLLWMVFQLLFALGIVVGLAYVTLRVLLPQMAQRLQPTLNSPRGLMAVADTIEIKRGSQLHLVGVAGRWFLLASSEAGMQKLTEVDAALIELTLRELEQAKAQAAPHTPARRLTDLLQRLWRK